MVNGQWNLCPVKGRVTPESARSVDENLRASRFALSSCSGTRAFAP